MIWRKLLCLWLAALLSFDAGVAAADLLPAPRYAVEAAQSAQADHGDAIAVSGHSLAQAVHSGDLAALDRGWLDRAASPTLIDWRSGTSATGPPEDFIGTRRALLSGTALRPSLSLNFLNAGPLDPRITFSRASTATYTNASGNLATAASGVARFDYSPTSIGTPLGFLVEGQATNLFINSKIDGTNLSTQTITTTATATTISFYGTGTIVLTGTATAAITGTGAYPTRTTYTFTPTAGSLTATVTGTVQYAQAEAQGFATSFIPTAGSVATRAADNATMTGTNFSSWFNPAQGTFVVDATSSGQQYAGYINLTGGSEQQIYDNGSANYSVKYGSVNLTINKGSTKIATTYSQSGTLAISSSNIFSNASAFASTAMGLVIGVSTYPRQLNGHLRSLTFYPTALPSSTLQGLTR